MDKTFQISFRFNKSIVSTLIAVVKLRILRKTITIDSSKLDTSILMRNEAEVDCMKVKKVYLQLWRYLPKSRVKHCSLWLIYHLVLEKAVFKR